MQVPFPLLADAASYQPNTFDINQDADEYDWWLQMLEGSVRLGGSGGGLAIAQGLKDHS